MSAVGGPEGCGTEEGRYEEDEDEFLFNEYSIDDSLDSLTRLERYHTSDFSLQRMVLVRDIIDTAKEAGHEATMKRLLPLLQAFVADSEPAVRQTLADQLFPLAEFVYRAAPDEQAQELGYNELLNHFLPFSVDLLTDKNSDVGKSAVQALLKICEMVKQEHLQAHVLTVIHQLAYDDKAEDYRVVAAELCNELAPLLGTHLCMAKIVPIVQVLARDGGFAVRRAVAANLGKVSKTLGPEGAVAETFPLYQRLSKDMIWGVRKACAESIADISEAVTTEVREDGLAKLFNSFLEDISRWVRVAASTNLGPYLHTFGPDACPVSLVKTFTEMAFQSESGTNTEYPEYCAYNLPAVALTIGPERWGELEPAFLALVKDIQWKVRRTLSYSLHETAKIVGQDITERTLTQALDIFLRDLDEVKVGCLQNVASLLSVMGEEVREYYTPQLCQMAEESDSWRLRMLIGRTLGDLANLVSPSFTQQKIVPMCIKMIDDSVSDVRQAMFLSCAKVLKCLCAGSNNEHEELLKAVLHTAELPTFQKRQILPYIAREVVCATENYDLFESDLLQPLLTLAADPVANVRLVAAKCLFDIAAVARYAEHDDIGKALEQLQQDKDRDTAHLAGNLEAENERDPKRVQAEADLMEAQATVMSLLEESFPEDARQEWLARYGQYLPGGALAGEDPAAVVAAANAAAAAAASATADAPQDNHELAADADDDAPAPAADADDADDDNADDGPGTPMEEDDNADDADALGNAAADGDVDTDSAQLANGALVDQGDEPDSAAEVTKLLDSGAPDATDQTDASTPPAPADADADADSAAPQPPTDAGDDAAGN